VDATASPPEDVTETAAQGWPMKQLRHDLRRLLNGLNLYLAFVVGRIPIHSFRLLYYRRVLGMDVGASSSVHWRAVFYAPRGVRVGSNSIIGNDCFLDGRRGIQIGDNVNIGGHVQIFTLEHDPQSETFATQGGPVVIGDRAYVATRATILPGVTIGEGAVVAAGAVVTKDVAPYTVVGGVPARFIQDRNRNLTYRLKFHHPFQ
jgi:acetyltransferase-like isoleucine patch superfamily enzyme